MMKSWIIVNIVSDEQSKLARIVIIRNDSNNDKDNKNKSNDNNNNDNLKYLKWIVYNIYLIEINSLL